MMAGWAECYSLLAIVHTAVELLSTFFLYLLLTMRSRYQTKAHPPRARMNPWMNMKFFRIVLSIFIFNFGGFFNLPNSKYNLNCTIWILNLMYFSKFAEIWHKFKMFVYFHYCPFSITCWISWQAFIQIVGSWMKAGDNVASFNLVS